MKKSGPKSYLYSYKKTVILIFFKYFSCAAEWHSRGQRFVFPTDDSLFKMLYLAMMDITKKWTGRRMDWSRIHAQLAVYFDDRMPD